MLCGSPQDKEKNTKKPALLKRNILLQDITDLALQPNFFHYIEIATHISGNSTYKAWQIEISELNLLK